MNTIEVMLDDTGRGVFRVAYMVSLLGRRACIYLDTG